MLEVSCQPPSVRGRVGKCPSERDRGYSCAGLTMETASSCRWVACRRGSSAKHPGSRPADTGPSERHGRTPASTTRHTLTRKQKRSTSSKVSTPSTPTTTPPKESGQALSSSSPRARFMGSALAQKAADFSVYGHRRLIPRSLEGTAETADG